MKTTLNLRIYGLPSWDFIGPPSVKTARTYLTQSHRALSRGCTSNDKTQVVDAINSATAFIKLAKQALVVDDDPNTKVSLDKFGRLTVTVS